MRILITGSRDWTDDEVIERALWDALRDSEDAAWLAEQKAKDPNGKYAIPAGGDTDSVTVVHGACPTGADAIADKLVRYYAQSRLNMNWILEVYPADWETHGKAAGPIRNHEMVERGADVCLAFIKNESRGASMTARFAEEAGIRTVVYTE